MLIKYAKTLLLLLAISMAGSGCSLIPNTDKTCKVTAPVIEESDWEGNNLKPSGLEKFLIYIETLENCHK